MGSIRVKLIAVMAFLASGVCAQEAPVEASMPDVGAETFVMKCAGCHTVGGGGTSAPDLLPSTQWSEADLTTAIRRMEKNVGPMKDEEVAGLVSLLKDSRVKERLAEEQKRAVARFTAQLEPASPAKGRQLFWGETALKNGGLACAACHQVDGSGGTLARDLTDVHARMGETGLRSAIQQASFNVMRAAYREHPITPDEANHLTAYLGNIQASSEKNIIEQMVVPMSGVAGGFMFFGMMVFLYRGRQHGTRRRLTAQANRR